MIEIQKNGLDFIKHTENILDFLKKHTNSYDVIIITPYQESLEGDGDELCTNVIKNNEIKMIN